MNNLMKYICLSAVLGLSTGAEASDDNSKWNPNEKQENDASPPESFQEKRRYFQNKSNPEARHDVGKHLDVRPEYLLGREKSEKEQAQEIEDARLARQLSRDHNPGHDQDHDDALLAALISKGVDHELAADLVGTSQARAYLDSLMSEPSINQPDTSDDEEFARRLQERMNNEDDSN